MNEQEEKKQKESQEIELLISKCQEKDRTITFSDEERIHKIQIHMKGITGLACYFCKIPLNKETGLSEETYFCPTYNYFMCKTCLIERHKAPTTMAKPQHYDLKVKLTQ